MRAVACAAVAMAAIVAPAHAVDLGGHAQRTAGDDASMCFSFPPAAAGVGGATATGMVRTEKIQLPDQEIRETRFQPLTTLVADVRPLASTEGYGSVCVGGVGAKAVAGFVQFTFEMHTVTDDYVNTVYCTYGGDMPTCV